MTGDARIGDEALRRFQALLEQAKASALREPTATVLVTVDGDGRPSTRLVLLKGADREGFVFYTNLDSRKGKQLLGNPDAALCFPWDRLGYRARVRGRVRGLSPEEADAYWRSRPRLSQLGAWASRQSQPLPMRAWLILRVLFFWVRFFGRPVPRPPHWSGFRLAPESIEFWRLDAGGEVLEQAYAMPAVA